MNNQYDVIVVGGGPAGATCAMVMAREGFKVCILEKARHPRFHIGETFLPRLVPLLDELGLSRWKELPHVTKYGAEFAFGNDPNSLKFKFADGLLPGRPVFNIERAIFDKMLIDEAKKAGATVLEDTAVKQITRLEAGHVEVQTADQTYSGKILMDASGQGTLVGRHLGVRKNFDDPVLQKVAYFQHFEGVERLPGDHSGYPTLFMAKEGWLWFIALNETKTSVGFVTRPSFVKEIGVPPDRLLQWALARTPLARNRMKNATGASTNFVLSDFSYRCQPYAGAGYFMLGDAACFLDPVFSTGLTLAMMSGNEGAKLGMKLLRNQIAPARAFKQYIKFFEAGTKDFWWIIRNYYKHSFRELFMNGIGPHNVHGAVISVLAGNVFPKPVWALRWRMKLFALCVWAQQYWTLCPRRPVFSLVEETPVELAPEQFNPAMAQPT